MVTPRSEHLFALAAALVAAAIGPASAQLANKAPASLKPLLDCRSVADRDTRLTCFDRETAAIATAVDRQDVVVADRQEITKVRRSLFGFLAPGVDFFNKDRPRKEDKPEQGVNEIDATIARAVQQGYGRWLLVLDDGARWLQIDDQAIARDPRPGMPVHIRRAAMGSFLANIDKQTAIRVRRQS